MRVQNTANFRDMGLQVSLQCTNTLLRDLMIPTCSCALSHQHPCNHVHVQDCRWWDSHNYRPCSARVIYSGARVNNCENLSSFVDNWMSMLRAQVFIQVNILCLNTCTLEHVDMFMYHEWRHYVRYCVKRVAQGDCDTSCQHVRRFLKRSVCGV
jgi:hypothetical protein